MNVSFVSLVLCAAVVCLTGCIPHGAAPESETIRSQLLTENESISQVRMIAAQGKTPASGKAHDEGRVFELAGERFKRETERLLRQQKRWSDEGGLILHVEIEKIVLRKNAAVLLFQSIAGADEMRVKLWLTSSGRVVVAEPVSSRSDAGGTYNTLSQRRRLELLADQVARKAVNRL